MLRHYALKTDKSPLAIGKFPNTTQIVRQSKNDLDKRSRTATLLNDDFFINTYAHALLHFKKKC